MRVGLPVRYTGTTLPGDSRAAEIVYPHDPTLTDQRVPTIERPHRSDRGRKDELEFLFWNFPRGWPGAGLALLRGAVGVTAIIHGWRLVASPDVSSTVTWLVGVPAVLSGAALIVGLFTPAAAILFAAGTVAVAFNWFPWCRFYPIHSRLALILLITMCLVITLIGPGAVSLDARLFGRRKVVVSR